MLQIDNDANQLVYGANTTPRMIFEGRATHAPSNAVVAFRDQLEEATSAARAARTGHAAPAAASTPPAQTGAATAPLSSGSTPAEATPQPFEPVEDNPATVEPLPETP